MTQALVLEFLKKNPNKWFLPIEIEKSLNLRSNTDRKCIKLNRFGFIEFKFKFKKSTEKEYKYYRYMSKKNRKLYK